MRTRVAPTLGPLAETLFAARLLFTLTGPASSLEEGLDALLAAPPSHLRSELDTIAAQRVLPARIRALADGDLDALLELTALGAALLNATWPDPRPPRTP